MITVEDRQFIAAFVAATRTAHAISAHPSCVGETHVIVPSSQLTRLLAITQLALLDIPVSSP